MFRVWGLGKRFRVADFGLRDVFEQERVYGLRFSSGFRLVELGFNVKWRAYGLGVCFPNLNPLPRFAVGIVFGRSLEGCLQNLAEGSPTIPTYSGYSKCSITLDALGSMVL